tara:strand:+ start:98 stop:265 length:168 start_codon:yes stop_codon:yes gene_type:complete
MEFTTNELVTIFSILETEKRELLLSEFVDKKSNAKASQIGEIQDKIQDIIADRIN